MTKVLKFKEYKKLNESFAEIAVKNWALLGDAAKEIGNEALVPALEKALKLKADKLVHASDKDDSEGVALFMDMIESELAKKVKTISVENIQVEIYEMKLYWFAYFAMKVNGKPSDNIVISEVALDKLN